MAQMPARPKGPCFQCGGEHYKRNCPQLQRTRVRATTSSYNEDGWCFEEESNEPSESKVTRAARAMAEMTPDEKKELFDQLSQGGSRIFRWPDQCSLDQINCLGSCILVESPIYVNMSIFAHVEQEG